MFISKMNKLFHKHGRIAFAVLTVLIIVPFVLYFSVAPSEILGMLGSSSKGNGFKVKIYGNVLSKQKVVEIINNYINSRLFLGDRVNYDSIYNNKKILEKALDRYRLVREANKIGIKVDDLKLASYIRENPMFMDMGVFSIALYKDFLKYISQYGISEKELLNSVRNDIKIEMLRNLLMNSVVWTKEGAKDYYRFMYKVHIFKILPFKVDDYISKVRFDSDQLREFFEKNRSKYVIPDRYRFIAVKFSMAANVGVGLNNNAREDENSFKEKAQRFAVEAFEKIEHSINSGKKVNPAYLFVKLAKEKGYRLIRVNSWIEPSQKNIFPIGYAPNIASVLPTLYADQPISNAIKDGNAYYVICLVDTKPSHLASFSEVKEKVIKDYKREKAFNLAIDYAMKAYKEIKALLKEGKDPSKYGYKFVGYIKAKQDDYYKILRKPYGRYIARYMDSINNNSISKPIITDNGPIILYKVKSIYPKKIELTKKRMERYIDFRRWLIWYNYPAMLKRKSKTVIEKL